MSGKKAIKVVGIIILVLGVAILGGNIMLVNRTAEVQQNMKEYLQKSYDEDFVVGKVMVTGNEGFGYKTYVAEAFPQDDPNLKFHVKREKGKPGTYDDSYLITRRSTQGKIEIGNYLKKIYGQDVPLTYKLSTRNKELQGLNHNEILTKHGEDVFFQLQYYIFVDKIDKQMEAERSYKVLKKFVLDNNLQHYYFIIDFLSNNYKEEFYKGFFQDTDEFVKAYDIKKLHEEQKMFNYLIVDHDSDIKSSEDLERCFFYK